MQALSGLSHSPAFPAFAVTPIKCDVCVCFHEILGLLLTEAMSLHIMLICGLTLAIVKTEVSDRLSLKPWFAMFPPPASPFKGDTSREELLLAQGSAFTWSRLLNHHSHEMLHAHMIPSICTATVTGWLVQLLPH